MRFCDKCKVNIRGTATFCPLCQSELTGEMDAPVYPRIKTLYQRLGLFFKLLILGTVVAGVASVAVNLILPQTGYWSLLVLCGIGCFWVSFFFIIRKRHNLPKSMLYQVVLISVISILWDNLTHWRGWSLDYVIPITCVAAMVSMAVVAKVLHMPVSDYIVCIIADTIFGIVPILFYVFDMVNVVIPSIICISISVISLVTLILFEGKNIRMEIIKRLHI